MKLFGKYRSVREMLSEADPKFLEKKFPHGRPTSRRDLLKSGALSFAASFTAPTLLETLMMSNVAHAQNVACAQSPVFVGVKANGGMNMLGNAIVMGSNGDLIDTYSQVGGGPRSELINRLSTVFGNAKFFDGSQVLAGIQQEAAATTLLNTTQVTIPVASTDDSDTNAFDITYYITKLGVVGSILSNLGVRQTLTGLAQQPALDKAPPTPLPVNSVNDIADALTVRGSLAVLSDAQKSRVFQLINKLSESQARSLASQTGGQVLQQLVNEATGTNTTLVGSTTAGIDPLQDQTVSGAFNTLWQNGNQNLNQAGAGDDTRVYSSMVYNALKGNAGTVNLEIGGADYHGQGRQTQDAKDLEVGVLIGRVLQSAAIMQRPVMVMLTTDGSVGAPAGSAAGAAFTGDRGQGGAIMLFAYHPLARPASTDRNGAVNHQIGFIRGQAGVDTDFLTGNNPALAGLAAAVNFASFAGKTSQMADLIGGLWNTDQLATVTRIRQVK